MFRQLNQVRMKDIFDPIDTFYSQLLLVNQIVLIDMSPKTLNIRDIGESIFCI
jgi:hypothetical protein